MLPWQPIITCYSMLPALVLIDSFIIVCFHSRVFDTHVSIMFLCVIKDEQRLRCSVVAVTPLNYSQECKRRLEEIKELMKK